MIMTLMGKSLRDLRLRRERKVFTVSTWIRLAIQSLYAIKLLHDIGFIHRDLKPANFTMGHSECRDRARLVHLLDFGLAR
jgi:serine/threonine protein kinase